jgi:hypothetical protein
MSEPVKSTGTLREIEMEVMAEGREWMRQRLEERLKQAAERDGRVFPPQRKKGPAPTHGMDNVSDRSRKD